MHTREEQMKAFGRLLDVLDQLREKCPWDKKQTFESLRPNTIEETYELCDALTREDYHDAMKELGDVMMHLCFYAKIGSEKNAFDIYDVLRQQADKLIFRHPHIYHPSQVGQDEPKPMPYGEETNADTETGHFSDAKTAEQVLQNWEQIKLKEKDGNKRVLSGVPAALPSVIKAYRIQDKARNVGFDWEKKEDVWAKVVEEVGEVQEAAGSSADLQEEFGDLLFAVINAARLYGVDAEVALGESCSKFRRRFNYIEASIKAQGRTLSDATLADMDALWDQAKDSGL